MRKFQFELVIVNNKCAVNKRPKVTEVCGFNPSNTFRASRFWVRRSIHGWYPGKY